jgi:hypothetical protein
MNKIEILKLAFEKAKDAQEAMNLAHQMVAFVSDMPMMVEVEKLNLHQPIGIKHEKRRHWSDKEIELLRALMEQGRSIAEISIIMKRSAPSIDKAVYKLGSGRQLGKHKAA